MIYPTGGDVFPELFLRVWASETLATAKLVKENWSPRLSSLMPPATDDNNARSSNAAPSVRGVRFFIVLVDSSGDRYRDLPISAAASFEDEMNDWPLDAVRNGHYILRETKRRSRTFGQSHSEWVQASGIRSGDRFIHEHFVLSQIWGVAVTYNQLNLPNVAALEVAMTRRKVL